MNSYVLILLNGKVAPKSPVLRKNVRVEQTETYK